MKEARRQQLEDAGWRVGDAAEFLGLTAEDIAIIEMHEHLSAAVRERRNTAGMTQSELGRRIGSSQSRIAKLELGLPGVSFDLMLRALTALGVNRSGVGRILIGSRSVRNQKNEREVPTRERKAGRVPRAKGIRARVG